MGSALFFRAGFLSVGVTLMMAAAASPAAAQQTNPNMRVIQGVLTDSAGRPIPWVNVQVARDRRIIADDSGRFRVELDRRRPATIDLRRIGYQHAQVRLQPGGDTTLAVTLVAVATALAGETVRAPGEVFRSLELHGFYRRMIDKDKGINAGQFLTVEDIEMRKPSKVTQLFTGLSGVKVVRTIERRAADGSRELPTNCMTGQAECIAPAGLNNCPMSVYLNNVRMNSVAGFRATGTVGDVDWATGLDHAISPNAVAGIEIYTSPARTPPEFQRLGGNCGAILIWTK